MLAQPGRRAADVGQGRGAPGAQAAATAAEPPHATTSGQTAPEPL